MGVPKDSVDKVTHGNTQVRDNGKYESYHQSNSFRLDIEDELKHASSRRGSEYKEHRENRLSDGEKVTRNNRSQLSS